MYFPSSFFSVYFIKVQVVQPYSSTDTTTVWKNSKEFRFSYGCLLSVAVHALRMQELK